MIQIAAGLFLVIGGIALIVFGAANHIADPAKIRIVGVKTVEIERRFGMAERVQPEEWLYMRPGASLTLTNGKGEADEGK
jgi:hypothetical protein